ncbi:DoxX family protein [Parerythrobacter jejuensis]|uniref:DoxX family membrane protein n=1 Tax=Parerythrobacter jejuensis TaxID=795812 RepID=A0A845ALE8_9SPHN|nr:DoxX family protein [Parerythrobacter jejuensis]MXP30309.1 DoxX family membrane protein [Parerythrobacter jejuensis]MXP33069.1 DoxX family membrane protein [Parerythrobacter jejuensis]
MIRTAFRWLLAFFYGYAGWQHLANPDFFMAIMPPWVPQPDFVVWLTGIAELLGAAALVQPVSKPLMRAAGVGLALYALCVWPANIHHFAMDMARDDGGLGLGYHIPRMIAQPIIIWLALWASEATNWPFARHTN